MIDGEIYVDSANPDVVFAYRGASYEYTLHYICVTSYNEVKRYGDRTCVGQIIVHGECIPANDEQKARFKRLLAENDYHWNKANRKVIRISTGELL